MLGLTQLDLAELIGVTYQQMHKYENGINRVSAGRLYPLAQALEVEVSYFYQEMTLTSAAVDSRRISACCWSWRATSRVSHSSSTRRRSVIWRGR